MAWWTLGIDRGKTENPGGVTASASSSLATVTSDASAADTAVGTVVTDTTTADTNTGTVVTDLATTLTNFDTAAAAIIAITGDGYTAHQFTTGGSTGLTSAQCHTIMGLLNTALTALLASQTACTTAKSNTATAKADAATAKTATALVVTDTGGAANDMSLVLNTGKSLTREDTIKALRVFELYTLSNAMPNGSAGTDLPPL